MQLSPAGCSRIDDQDTAAGVAPQNLFLAERMRGAQLKRFLHDHWHGPCSGESVANLFSPVAPLQYALDFHMERHNLLASNLANVDTPRYKPLDLARVGDANGDFAQVLQDQIARTNPAHMSVDSEEPMVGRVFQDLTAGGGADGNFVSMDRESGKLAANRLRYDVVSVLVKSQLDQLMKAASDGKG